MSTIKTTNLQHPSAADPSITLTSNGSMVPAYGYLYHSTVYFTSSGTFTKATYPWLRAIRVKVQGAGGGGGGAAATTASQMSCGGGGAGGGYAESFITDIAGLSASVTVTVGSGGAGGVGAANGSAGGGSSFGSSVVANGGEGGARELVSDPVMSVGSYVGVGVTGDLLISGDAGGAGYILSNLDFRQEGGGGGGSVLGAAQVSARSTLDGINGFSGRLFGGGGTGAANPTSDVNNRPGGAGAAGIVIVELYA